MYIFDNQVVTGGRNRNFKNIYIKLNRLGYEIYNTPNLLFVLISI